MGIKSFVVVMKLNLLNSFQVIRWKSHIGFSLKISNYWISSPFNIIESKELKATWLAKEIISQSLELSKLSLWLGLHKR